ncbi:hypothetical protein C1H46_043222 [Malus baccata]|uniref:Uncharacterized protein n=1 Tax=Malus baccata TaxID=106549 RepID=A0A540KAI8_MALBA|nr:hypothetical protein C1H46_043222 [Malus baccata]
MASAFTISTTENQHLCRITLRGIYLLKTRDYPSWDLPLTTSSNFIYNRTYCRFMLTIELVRLDIIGCEKKSTAQTPALGQELSPGCLALSIDKDTEAKFLIDSIIPKQLNKCYSIYVTNSPTL